jgi:hypothetical protein
LKKKRAKNSRDKSISTPKNGYFGLQNIVVKQYSLNTGEKTSFFNFEPYDLAKDEE